MVLTHVPSKHFIGLLASQIGIEQLLFFKFIHSPFAHLKGVSIGHPLIEGHISLMPTQLPSGQNLSPLFGHFGVGGQDPSLSAQLPSLHLIGI